MTEPYSRLIRALLILLIVGYAAFFSAQLILHYYSFGSRALDLGNMSQTIWNTSQGRLFHQTNQPGLTSRLSLHVEPILIPVSLLYYLYSGPEILFVFQSIIVALGAIPVYALANLKLKNEGLALLFALVYLMLPAIQAATLLDFHAVTLAPTFLLAAFYFLETRRPFLFGLFALLAVACKEEIALLVMMMGFYAFIVKREYRLGLITVVLTAFWAYLAVFVIPNTLATTGNIHWDRYGHLGEDPLQIVLNLFQQPELFLNHLQAVNAATYLRLLLTPTAFTALLNPVTLLLAFPSLGINLLSNFPPMQEANSLIYAAPLLPAIIISSIFGLALLHRLIDWTGRKWIGPNTSRAVARTQVAGNAGQDPAATDQTARTPAATNRPPERLTSFLKIAVSGLILIFSLGYHADYGYFPGGGQFRGWEEVTEHHRAAGQIFAQIPPEAALSAQDRLNPHVSHRETLYIFDQIENADHIVLDVTQDSWPLHPVALRHRVDQFLDDDFGVVDAANGYLLLARDRPDLPRTLPDTFFDFARVEDPAAFSPEFPANIIFDGKLQLLGYSFELGGHERFLPVITLYWRALTPLENDYVLWPFFIDRNGRVIDDPAERPLVTTLWYPTSRWSPEEVVVTRTLPRDLAPQAGDEFTLALGVANGSWSDPTGRLPITSAPENLYTFDDNTWARLGTVQRTGRKQYRPLSEYRTSPQYPHQAQFWHVINLKGTDLPATSLQPGDVLPFTLYWQSIAPITVDLTTFAHLVDSQGNTVAQLDWTPQDSIGYLPTSTWQPERYVVDSKAIPLPEGLAPGQYRLVVGWYYPPTGERLPLTAGEGLGEDDTAEIGTISIE
jgi:uncharacterized membrane protein